MEREKHYSIISDILFLIRHFMKYQPIVVIFSVIEIILGMISPLLAIYLPKIAVDLVVDDVSFERAVLVLGGFAILSAVVSLAECGIAWGKYNFNNEQRPFFMGLLFEKSLRLNYGLSESPKVDRIYWKAITSLRYGDGSSTSLMVTSTVYFCVNLLGFFTYSTVIGTLNLWMLLGIIILSLINCAMSIKVMHYYESIREEQAILNKKYSCVKGSMGKTTVAKDIRMFNMNHWMIALRDKVIGDMSVIHEKTNRRTSWYEKLTFATALIRDMGAYTYLIYQAVKGNVSISEFVLLFGAITGFSRFVLNVMSGILNLRRASNDIDYIRSYFELPEEDLKSGRSIEGIKTPIEIEFRNVSYSYKGNENSEDVVVFNDFNLKISAGEKIALVGVNGAGKTTLIKLLTGMYEADSGEILFNGINRNEFAKEEFFKLFSVVFQEHLMFPFTVGENIALSRSEKVDKDKAWKALEKAGMKQVLKEKGIELETYMTKTLFDDGVEFSGGQNQRLLLARALYKDAPILVLDEPTAALDPIAESEIYDSYAQHSEGKTAIFISHRLASTRFSDRIIMIEDGKIIEMGTHDELMKKCGKYAEMFEIQSSYYEERGEKYGE